MVETISTTSTGIKRQVQIASACLKYSHEHIELARQRISEIKKQKQHTAVIDQSIRRTRIDFSAAVENLVTLLTSLDEAVREEAPAVAWLQQQHRQIWDIAENMEQKVRKLENDVGHSGSHKKFDCFVCQMSELFFMADIARYVVLNFLDSVPI
jgi:hypothetical protein